MNKVILVGRLTRDPDVKYSGEDGSLCVARYGVAVDRPRKSGEDNGADFPSCVAFGKTAEFAERYLRKGMKVGIVGHIQTGSYVNNDGVKIYTTDVIIENQEFVESKAAQERHESEAGGGHADRPSPSDVGGDGFMNIPDGIDEELPFK